MFCNGMVVLHDGRVFINGGNLQYDPFFGEPRSAVFDPQTHTFTNVQNMAHGRWYPTVTTLGTAANAGAVRYNTPGTKTATFRVTDNRGLTTATVAPVNGFNCTVAFSVTGLPSGATATFSPASVTTSHKM